MDKIEQIRELLKLVYDPELGISIIDLGLVYDVQWEGKTVYVKMTLTTPGCPMHDMITGGVDFILKDRLDVDEVEIDVVWEPRWTPAMISDEGRATLNTY
ncbi:metal-sulfur cluster assembly factor [Sporosarcina sp. HYO08]|uniref:metal-sulfur cluster assembly factor n=1 Tax=Sporosarcina sp. HYO08 TaxID=1759557 RepID=UPI00079226C2|nr:metal-sulfur cluster assembly factor [Sporosarcina sp. HYO08]KXH78810.1 aromatic ring hydroxylase [Sporosarcina sp. HYO08]